ncbi:MAG: plastocyanin/azurin family copper-binding protein [Pyrinomonadaceae bacterium]
MKKTLFLIFFAAALCTNAFAHQAFTLVSSEKKIIKYDDLIAIEKERTLGKKDGTTLTFTENEIRLVVVTGPEDDMLSYRIQGMRNPTLVVPSGAKIKILFVNVDEDMKHDIRFGHVVGEFMIAQDVKETAGSEKLPPKSEESLQAEEIVVKANEDGVYKYFCSVRGHAKGGMWGNIAVGVKPGDLKMPKKTTHVHSPDEDKMDDMPGMNKDKPPVKKPDEMSDMPDMAGMGHAKHGMKMSSVTNIGDPMDRESSGTAWAPDSSPMYARMKMYEDGSMLMLMGTAYLRYTSIGSSRDVSVAGKGSRSRVDAPSMFMLMYSKPITARSQIGFRVMASLDPFIERGYGYPLLYQSGEQFAGQPIHDRQHPHDLFSELAVTYSYKFNNKRSFYLYAGYPGEPALGPPTFMHRQSASNNPDAPIGHHWQDATHITFGVVTAGFSFGRVKIEASAFNGREADSDRLNFDRPRLNSTSGRLSFNPTKDWAFQISHGYLKNPEISEPDVHVLHKTTASAIYNKKFDDERNLANTFVWGQNYANGERTNSILFESNYDFNKNAVFGRFERVQKSGHDLVLAHALEKDIFWVGSASLGYVRDIVQGKGIDVGLGAMATINTNTAVLTPYYGGTTHAGWQFFMRFRPSRSN